MAYGRLDIHYPNGDFRSYLLEDLTVSIGRAEANSITLDTETVSRYHLSITHDPRTDTVTLTDLESENGTSVDGVLLTPNEPRKLDGVEEIQIGDVRVIFHPIDDAPTLPISPTDDDTARIEREDYPFNILVEKTHIDVWPASSTSVELAITNTSDEPQRFVVRAMGMPVDWVRSNRPEVHVQPDDTAYVMVNVKPPRRPNTVPGAYTMQVQVSPRDKVDQVLEAVIDVTIHGYRGFGIGLGRRIIDAGDPLALYLHNQGNEPLNVMVSGRAPEGGLKFNLPLTPITLAPGQRSQVRLGIVADQPPIVGTPADYPFMIVARSQDIAAFTTVVEGRATVNPRLPLWTAVSALGILASIVIIAFLAVGGLLNRPPEPQITDLIVSATELEQGEPLTLSWVADDVEQISVSVNDLIVDQLNGDATGTTLETSELSGLLEIVITGENAGVAATASAQVTVTLPIVIEQFTVEPPSLVRHVVETLTLRWDVRNAETVRIEGLSAFTIAPLPSTLGITDQLEGIGGIATEPLILNLIAENASGQTVNRRVTVTISDPICVARAEITLREGPDDRYQPVGQIPASGEVIVDGQDATAGWLRTNIAGGVRGWADADLFDCAPNFQVANLRTILDVPALPAPTATGTPALTPTANPTTTPQQTPVIVTPNGS